MPFNTPNIFIGGTKAKAVEVNENFQAVKDELNSHTESIVEIQGTVQDAVDYVNGDLRSELEELALSARTKFSLNSGNVDEFGKADILCFSGNEISFKVGGEYPSLFGTSASGKDFTLESLESINVVQLDKYSSIVPAMSSNENPQGYFALSSSQQNTTNVAYKAFDKANEMASSAASAFPFVVRINLPASKLAKKAKFTPGSNLPSSFDIVGTNDNGSTYSVLYSYPNSERSSLTANTSYDLSLNNNQRFTSYGIRINANVSGANAQVVELDLFVLDSDGAYYFDKETKNIAATPEGAEVVGKIYTQRIQPEGVLNDIWNNTAVEPNLVYKYDGKDWLPYNGVPIGFYTLSGGKIAAVKTFPYNQNGYDINVHSWDFDKAVYVLESWNSGSAWYRIWSDGWIEQGGVVTDANTINLNIPFTTNTYNVQWMYFDPAAALNGTAAHLAYDFNVRARNLTNFTPGGARATAQNMWTARGF